MCGICGWIQWSDHENDFQDKDKRSTIVKRMVNSLKPRGPDEEGTWVSDDGICSFGHTRLVVLDPKGGKQPLLAIDSKNNKFCITYNGELYNTEEIRLKLLSKGHTFKGYSDVEVVLHAYMEWKENCLEQFNGMFAFGIWDGTQLFIARDRLGIKPFYYSIKMKENTVTHFIFGSEIKSLLENPLITRDVPFENLAITFTTMMGKPEGFVPFRDIRQLEPGYCGIISKKACNIWRYWNLQSFGPLIKCENESGQKVHDLLKDSVEKQMVSDVPICGLLSGGLDSCAVVNFMYQKLESMEPGSGHNLQTFSLGLPGLKDEFEPTPIRTTSDARYIDIFQNHYKTSHKWVPISNQDLISTIESCTIAKDYPIAADGDTSLYLLFRDIKKSATVVLSGEGADELFGGYLHYYLDNNEKYRMKSPDAGLFDNFLKDDVKEKLNPAQVRELTYLNCVKDCPNFPDQSESERKFNLKLYSGFKQFLRFLLERKDRMSMASSVEVRVPFLDHKLVEYGFQICRDLKFKNGQEKYILRKSMESEPLFPEEIRTRQKAPYPTAFDHKTQELCRNLLRSLLDSDTIDERQPIFRYFDKIKVLHALDTEFRELSQQFPVCFWDVQILCPMFFYSCNFWLKYYKVNIV